jgi:adenine-specific DNA-methyltransferase
MEPLTAQEPLAQTADLAAQNLDRLRQLFPDAVTEDGVDLEVLRQLLGGAVATAADERYGLHWHGKRQARQLALLPSTGTLRPAPTESENWDTTQNLMIEGDNLEVLKLLQKSYAGQVKLIYIDPPYNTGKDFVYPDNFKNPLGNYLELTGQVVDGEKMSSNTETSGRFHTDWLNMMYPRLKVARELMREDGVIFVSIDSAEVSNLCLLLNEIFGQENSVGIFPTIMNLKGNNDAFGFSDTHEFTIVYARDKDKCALNGMHVSEEGLEDWQEDEVGMYKRADTLRRTGQDASRESRPKGWFPVFIDAENNVYVTENDLPKSEDDLTLWPISENKEELSWTWSKRKIIEEGFNLLVVDGRNGKNIYKKQRPSLGELPTSKPKSTIYKPEYSSSNGTAEVKYLLGTKVFDNPPKPRALIRDFVLIGASKDSLILDFFAGTGTTGHAVMAQNAADGGNRRFILVQLPEPLDPAKKEQKTAAAYCDALGKPRTIAELTKERLRRAARKVQADNPLFTTGDLGFRVYRLASSNIKAWRPQVQDLRQTLLDYEDNLATQRTDDDLLTELQLKLGLPLTTPIEVRALPGGHQVHSLGAGTLLVCLSRLITDADAVPLATAISDWHQELAPAGDSQVLFRDSAFAGDVAKANLAAQLRQLIERVQVRSL